MSTFKLYCTLLVIFGVVTTPVANGTTLRSALTEEFFDEQRVHFAHFFERKFKEMSELQLTLYVVYIIGRAVIGLHDVRSTIKNLRRYLEKEGICTKVPKLCSKVEVYTKQAA